VHCKTVTVMNIKSRWKYMEKEHKRHGLIYARIAEISTKVTEGRGS